MYSYHCQRSFLYGLMYSYLCPKFFPLRFNEGLFLSEDFSFGLMQSGLCLKAFLRVNIELSLSKRISLRVNVELFLSAGMSYRVNVELSLSECFIMRQTACLVVNPIIVDGYASLFNCTTAVRASDPMTASS